MSKVDEKGMAAPPKRRKRRPLRKSKSGLIAISFLFAVVILYILKGMFSLATGEKIETSSVEYGSLDLPTVYKGVIIRDEAVYASKREGALYFNFGNFERIKKGDEIAYIQNDAAVLEIDKNIDDVQEKILEIQKRRDNISFFSQDVKNVDKKMGNILIEALTEIDGGKASKIYVLTEDLERNLSIRNNMLFSEDRGSTKDLVAKKNGYKEKIDQNMTRISANESGVLSDIVDGFEGTYTFLNAENLTKESVDIEIDEAKFVPKKTVKINEPMFKIIKNNEWFLLTFVPSDLVLDWKEGDVKSVQIEKDKIFTPLNMEISKIKKNETDSFVLFKTTKYMIDYANMRSVSLKVSDSAIVGLKIPESTIVDRTLLKIPVQFVENIEDVEKQSKLKVRRSSQGKEESIDIQVADFDENFVYTYQDLEKSVKLSDILVDKAGKTFKIAQVENIKGVFVVNDGYADFTKIMLDEKIRKKGGYTVIDPVKNKKIKANDRIVHDAKSIKDGQKVE